MVDTPSDTAPVNYPNYHAKGHSVTLKPGEFLVAWNHDVQFLEQTKFGDALRNARSQAVVAWSKAVKYPSDQQYPADVTQGLQSAHDGLYNVYVAAGYSDEKAKALLETDRVALLNAVANAMQLATTPVPQTSR